MPQADDHLGEVLNEVRWGWPLSPPQRPRMAKHKMNSNPYYLRLPSHLAARGFGGGGGVVVATSPREETLAFQQGPELGTAPAALHHGDLPTLTLTRLSPQTLPQLSIPLQRPPDTAGQPSTPETPASLGSPIVGVIDLTRFIKTVQESPVTHGGFSDIYKGEWVRECHEVEGENKDEGKMETVLVAIKLLRILAIKDQDCIKARKRLNREVYVWHRLEHPNIVKLFGTSYHMGGRPSMVMRWYRNGSAAEYLRDRISSEADRVALVLDVAQGLKYLHTLTPPIVHGDLKGNNVLITDDGHAALSDFGLSQVIEELVGPTGYTPSSPEVGPLRWQAPEFIEDETCQPGLETDVWSFGCTAYELLTGNIPYHYRLRDGAVIKDIQSGIKPPGPDDLVMSKHDRGIQDLLYRCCWSFSPSDRLQMAAIVSRVQDICAPHQNDSKQLIGPS